MRFLFCACAISYILNDWSGIDVDMAFNYIQKSMVIFHSKLSLHSLMMGHLVKILSLNLMVCSNLSAFSITGGSTYCAIASLCLMGKLNGIKNLKKTQLWCLQRQTEGFQGRLNKPEDTCYAFWIGASIEV